MKKRPGGLGSGLGALLPTEQQHSVRQVPLTAIRQNPRQPRTHFDEAALDDLAASIREHGIIQPLIVSEREDGGYELIAGERRWRAAERAGQSSVPVLVRETTPQGLLELALIENVQRADLNPLEEAHAYQALKDEFGLSDDEIARRVGKNNRVTVANTRRLLKLAPAAQQAVLENSISAGHGRALLKFDTPAAQVAALGLIVEHDLSVREAERLGDLVIATNGDLPGALGQLRAERTGRVGKAATSQPQPATLAPKPRSEPSADDREIGRELERVLGTPVNLVRTERELRVTIVFHTEELLQEFFDRLNRG